jgi:hypothetical protein
MRSWFVIVALAVAVLSDAALIAPARAGPAWWRVSDGHAEVWILGAPQVTPKAVFWDTSSVERRLAGAGRLIIAPQPKGGLAAMASVLGSAASSTPMEASLPAPLRKRFDKVAASIGKDAKAYDHWKPAFAGVMLAGDVYKSADLKQGEVEALVRKLARKAGVVEAPAGSFDVSVMANGAAALSPAGQQICLSGTLHGLELGPAKLKADAADWARGAPHISAPDPAGLACLAAMPAMQRQAERGVADETAALSAALKEPGRTLAVLDLQRLTMSGGVFDRLRAKGLTVSGPLP